MSRSTRPAPKPFPLPKLNEACATSHAFKMYRMLSAALSAVQDGFPSGQKIYPPMRLTMTRFLMRAVFVPRPRLDKNMTKAKQTERVVEGIIRCIWQTTVELDYDGIPLHDPIVRLGMALGVEKDIPEFEAALADSGTNARASNALYRAAYRIELPKCSKDLVQKILFAVRKHANEYTLKAHCLWEIGMEASALVAATVESMALGKVHESQQYATVFGPSDGPLPASALRTIVAVELAAPILSSDSVRDSLLHALRTTFDKTTRADADQQWRASALFLTAVLLRLSGVVSAGETSGRRMLATTQTRDTIIYILDKSLQWAANDRQVATNRVLTAIRNIVRGPAAAEKGTYCTLEMRDLLVRLMERSKAENGALLPHTVKTIQRIVEARGMPPTMRAPFISKTIAAKLEEALLVVRLDVQHRASLELACVESLYRIVAGITVAASSVHPEESECFFQLIPKFLSDLAGRGVDFNAAKRLCETIEVGLVEGTTSKLVPLLQPRSVFYDLCALAARHEAHAETILAILSAMVRILRYIGTEERDMWRQWANANGELQMAASRHVIIPESLREDLFSTKALHRNADADSQPKEKSAARDPDDEDD